MTRFLNKLKYLVEGGKDRVGPRGRKAAVMRKVRKSKNQRKIVMNRKKINRKRKRAQARWSTILEKKRTILIICWK